MPAELDLARRRDNPQDPDIDIWQLNYELLCGNAETAEGLAVRVIQRDPLFVPARMNLAQILRMRGDVAGAIRELEVILEQDPKNVYAIETKARAHAQAPWPWRPGRSTTPIQPTAGTTTFGEARLSCSPSRANARQQSGPSRAAAAAGVPMMM